MSCFYFYFFLLIFVFKVLGSPLTGVSPTFRTKVTLSLMQGFCFFLNPDVRWLVLWVMLRYFLQSKLKYSLMWTARKMSYSL